MDARLEVYCGGMFAGKSTELQRQGKRQELAGQNVVYLKPGIDTRDGENLSSTHDGKAVNAITVRMDRQANTMENVINIIPVLKADVVCIDEIQFFPTFFIRQVQKLLDLGKVVLVAGLDLDKKGRPFHITMELMARAEVVKKFTAICDSCGTSAWVSVETKRHEDTIAVGNDYRPMCRACAKTYWKGQQ